MTSESTETMTSDVARRTAWLMPLRLPMLYGLRRTVTFEHSEAALQAHS